MNDTQLYRTIGSITRESTSTVNLQVKELNLDNNLFVYLMRIVENEGLTQSELIDDVRVDKSTLSRALNKLENRGYITRQPNPNNKKFKLLYPTEKGRHVYPQLEKAEQAFIRLALSQLTAADKQQLGKLLNQIKAVLP